MHLIFKTPSEAISFLGTESQYWLKLLNSAQQQRDTLVDQLRKEYIEQKQRKLLRWPLSNVKKVTDTLIHPDERAFSTLQHIATEGHADHYFLSNLCEIVRMSAEVLVEYGNVVSQLNQTEGVDGILIAVYGRPE